MKKIWKPSQRDGRLYKDVIQLKIIIEVQGDVELEEWFVNAVIYCPLNGDQPKNIKIKMVNLRLGDLVTSRFDAISYIVNTVEHQKNFPLKDEIQNKLETCFDKIAPWKKRIEVSVYKDIRNHRYTHSFMD